MLREALTDSQLALRTLMSGQIRDPVGVKPSRETPPATRLFDLDRGKIGKKCRVAIYQGALAQRFDCVDRIDIEIASRKFRINCAFAGEIALNIAAILA